MNFRNRDALEEANVEIRESTIPSSGEGVFALRDIPKGTPACFYTGFTYRNREEDTIYRQMYSGNEARFSKYLKI